MFQFLETKTSNTRLGHQSGRNGFGIAFYKISVFEGDPLSLQYDDWKGFDFQSLLLHVENATEIGF